MNELNRAVCKYLYRNQGGMTYGFGGGGAFTGPKGHNFIFRQSTPNDFIEVSTDGTARWSANPTLIVPNDGLSIYNATDLNATYILLPGNQVVLGGGGLAEWGWL